MVHILSSKSNLSPAGLVVNSRNIEPKPFTPGLVEMFFGTSGGRTVGDIVSE